MECASRRFRRPFADLVVLVLVATVLVRAQSHQFDLLTASIFIKMNMDEFALGSPGLSSLGGQTLNPYDLKRHPGGSSGRTAVAVNVGFATVGLGTETGVSIRNPTSNNALIGIASTQGLVSRAGVIPVSFTQDRVGPH